MTHGGCRQGRRRFRGWCRHGVWATVAVLRRGRPRPARREDRPRHRCSGATGGPVGRGLRAPRAGRARHPREQHGPREGRRGRTPSAGARRRASVRSDGRPRLGFAPGSGGTRPRPERRRRRRPRRPEAHRGSEEYHHGRVHRRQHDGDRAVRDGAADHEVHVVEPVAEDGEAGRDRQRSQRDGHQRSHDRGDVPQSDADRQNDDGTDAREGEPLQLLPFDASGSSQAQPERHYRHDERAEEQRGADQAERVDGRVVDGIRVAPRDEVGPDRVAQRPTRHGDQHSDPVDPGDDSPRRAQRAPDREQQEHQHHRQARRDPGPQRDPLSRRAEGPPRPRSSSTPSLGDIPEKRGPHRGRAEQPSNWVLGVARSDQRAGPRKRHCVDGVQRGVVRGPHAPRERDRGELEQHRRDQQRRRQPSQLDASHYADSPNPWGHGQSCYRATAVSAGAYLRLRITADDRSCPFAYNRIGRPTDQRRSSWVDPNAT